MPKQRITKDMVVDAAFELARHNGMEQIMVKTIAAKIGCSVQPIYSYCKNMEGLRQEVMKKVTCFVREYIIGHMDRKNLFRSIGRAYIKLAEEEPNVFKMFVMYKRDGISSLQDIYQMEVDPKISEWIAYDLDIDITQAEKLYLNMLIYTIGVGTIFTMSSPGISLDEMLDQQDFVYEAFLKQVMSERDK